jgi:Fe2+ transport system protein FeoA
LKLCEVRCGTEVRIESVDVDEAEKKWLAAIGIDVGICIVVLRQAPFRGPLHVVINKQSEFAICESVSQCISVTEVKRLDE